MNLKGEERVIVIGGGVIGLCSAYFLARAGLSVCVVERGSSRAEMCSDQNAGMVVPSHFIPLAAPGVISQGLRWMLNRKSPFFLRPRWDTKLWSWIALFVKHSNRGHVSNSRELLRDLSLESRLLFEELSEELEFSLAREGLLMLCQSQSGLEEEKEVAEMAREIGLQAEVCSQERIHELDPDIRMNVRGGVWFPQDCHLDSGQFLAALREGIAKNGGEFVENEEVVDFSIQDREVTRVLTKTGREMKTSHLVVAGGAWSPVIAKKLGVRMPMQAGKGYSVTIQNPRVLPRLCSLLKEGRVAVTPMNGTLRVAGTMEICGNDLSIDWVRLSGIKETFCRFFPDFSFEDLADLEPWSGLRPCSPDGLPYIGRLERASNVVIATGHSMLGLSLGPITGQLVTDAIMHHRAVDDRLLPARFDS